MTPDQLAATYRNTMRNLALTDMPRVIRALAGHDDTPLASADTTAGPRANGVSDPTARAALRRRRPSDEAKDLDRWMGDMYRLSVALLSLAATVTADPPKHGPCWLCRRGHATQRLTQLGECAKCVAALAKAVDRGHVTADQWRADRRQNQNLSGVTEKVSGPRPNGQ